MSNYVDFVDGDFIASGTTLDDIYIALESSQGRRSSATSESRCRDVSADFWLLWACNGFWNIRCSVVIRIDLYHMLQRHC